jgi:hypothetical protein
MSWRRVRAIFDKELREYRHNGNIVYAMVILPLVFLLQPLIQIFTLPSSASATLHQHSLIYMLAIPALVPAALASYSVVGERLQGTLEPVLATPVRREELLLGKALAAFVPSLAVAYGVYAFFIAAVELFAHRDVASALIQGPDLLAQLLFTPLLAAWSIWVAIAVSARCSDPRTAGQLSILVSLPSGRGHHTHRVQRDPRDPDRGPRIRRRPADPRPPRLAVRLRHLRPRTPHHQHQIDVVPSAPDRHPASDIMPIRRRQSEPARVATGSPAGTRPLTCVSRDDRDHSVTKRSVVGTRVARGSACRTS